MNSPTATLDASSAEIRSTRYGAPQARGATPPARHKTDSNAAWDEERLWWTITSLFGVGLDLLSAVSLFEGDARVRVDRAVTELDQIIASLRQSSCIAAARNGDASPGARAERSL